MPCASPSPSRGATSDRALAWQRRGHGSALLKEAMRAARENGAKKIFLEVRPSNLAGKALYERFGFRKIALRRGYYPAQGGREDALVLSCPA